MEHSPEIDYGLFSNFIPFIALISVKKGLSQFDSQSDFKGQFNRDIAL